MQDITSILALIVSVIALALSALLAFRQIVLMNRANQWPLMVDLIQELRSQDFIRREHYVRTQLQNNLRELGVNNLSLEAVESAQVLASLFNSIGALIIFKVIDRRMAIATFGYRADRSWKALESFVLAERQRRGGDYMNYYEHFVGLVRETPPEQISASLRLKKVSS